MIKKVLTLLVTSTIISAGLLFMGFTMMQKFSPALAAPLEALVLGSTAQVSPTADFSVEDVQPAEDFSSNEDLSESSSLTGSSSDRSEEMKITGVQVKISDVSANPEQYRGQVLVITGIATYLSSEKIMVNDGTGDILVEIEDDWLDVAAINGMTVTVTAKIDDSSSPYEFELEACSLEDASGTIYMDDDCGDNSSDDMNDDDSSDDMYDDDSNDDMNDDDSDDDMYDDDSNDDSDDDDSSDDSDDDDSNDDSDDDSNDD